MKIVFLTTQSSMQSTVVGRVFPLAKEFQKMGHEVVVFLHSETPASSSHSAPVGATRDRPIADVTPGLPAEALAKAGVFPAGVTTRITGTNPFERTESGKKRHGGLRLIITMKVNALRAAWGLITERPDYIILVKPLPENTFAVVLSKLSLWKTKVILDVDDFELFANNLSSLLERAAIHLSQRVATTLASHIVAATPFLYDHMHQLVAGKKDITLIPTGLTAEFAAGKTPAFAKASAGKPGVTSAIGLSRVAPTGAEWDEEAGNHSILYIGSISVSSGHRVDLLPEILCEVRKQIPDATLVIAGSGDNEIDLKKRFQELNIEHAVKFFGRFSVDDISDVAAQATILIDPIDASIVSRAKSSFRCALALITAMPIVTSNIGIRTELIPKQLHGKLFAVPADATSYATRIIDILHAPLSDAEKAAMREQSKKYTWEHLARTYSKLFL
ncbi:MAG: glycosyltransferase [bacterium]|nr:glycosyltransferase [bacterium]